MYHLRYEGSFLSHSDVSWKVQIFQVAEEAFPEVGELRFDAEEPLVVEWEDVKKQGTVQGSTLTLQLDSPSDREYVHLYTISPRGVQVRVFRQEVLWWVGVMDSELYEEPYERENHYTVTLTFSDFAIADRLLLDQTGTVTLQELLSSLFKRGALYTTDGDAMQEMEEEFLDRLDTSLISTTLPEEEEAKLTPQRVAVSVSSFKEDEEEPETLRGALEKVMQPLGLRLVQKAGKLWLYDLHGLYLFGQRRPVTWNGSEQTLSVDSVIPAVSIKFKPEDEDAISPDVATPLLYKGGCSGTPDSKTYVFNSNQRAANDWHAEFGIFNGHSVTNVAPADFGLSYVLLLDSSMGSGPAAIHKRAAYARIVQCFSGDRKDFILWRTQPDYMPVVGANNSGYVYGVRTEIVENKKDYLQLDSDAAPAPAANFFANNADRSLFGKENVLLRTAPVYLPKIDETTTKARYPFFFSVNQDGTWQYQWVENTVFTYGLRLSIPLLVSPRYNLFGGDEDWNDKLNAKLLTDNLRAIFLPVRVRLRNSKNIVIWHWDNYMMEGADKEAAIDTNKPLDMKDQWMTGDYEDGEWALLTYAEFENDANRPTGVKFSSSAQTNKGQVYAFSDRLNIYKRYDGEILPYPPEAGFLEIEVGAGLRFLTVFDYPVVVGGTLNVTGAYFSERGLIYADHHHEKTINYVNGDIANLAKRPAYYNWLLRTIGVEMPKLTPVIRRSYPFAPFEDESDGTFEELAANEDKGEARYEGYIDSDAAELISIDNKIGTRSVETPNPTGLLLSAQTLRQLRKIRRADIADAPEWLLAATLFSHHDSPHLILSGEAVADPEGPAAYTDDPRQTARQAISLLSGEFSTDGTVDEQLKPLAVNWWENMGVEGKDVLLSPGPKNPLGLPNFRDFLLASETFDAISDTSEINLVEINPDIYVRADYPIPSNATEEEKALLDTKKKFKTGKQPNRII